MAHGINDHVPTAPQAGFSDEQFAELVRLLTPIHALAVKVHEQMPEVSEAPDEGATAGGRSESERGSG